MLLIDTLPYPRINAPNSTTYQFQVPGIGSHKAFGFWGGTATEQRDYICGASGLRPAFPVTISMWVKPWGFAEARFENILFREYFPSDAEGNGTWSAPFVTMQMYFTNAGDGTWGIGMTTGGVAHTIDCSVQRDGFRSRIQAQQGQWNHMGLTYDGTTLAMWINGLLGPTLAVSGAIDYTNPSAGWVIGSNPPVATATLNHLSASITELRIANGIRPSSWWQAMFESLSRSAH
jgi:hypothetical protein